MYTEQELTDIRKQQKRRWTALLIPCALFLIGVIVSIVLHIEWICTTCSLAIGILLIAGWDLLIKPLHRYEIHINNVLHGITHEQEGEFIDLSPDISLVDGVRYYAMNMSCLDERGKPYERLFYYDAEKPLPDLVAGQRIVVVYHDRALKEIRKI